MLPRSGTLPVQMALAARERRPPVGTRGSAQPAPMTPSSAHVTAALPFHAGGVNGPEVGVPLPARRAAWWRAAEMCTIQETALSCPAGCAGGPDHGQFSRWGPAPPAAGGRQGRTPSSEAAPLSAGTPARWSDAQARERRPLVGTRGSAKPAPMTLGPANVNAAPPFHAGGVNRPTRSWGFLPEVRSLRPGCDLRAHRASA